MSKYDREGKIQHRAGKYSPENLNHTDPVSALVTDDRDVADTRVV